MDKFKEVLVKDIAKKIQYGYTGKTVKNGEYRYLRITDIQNQKVEWETVPLSDISSKEEIEKYKLEVNDILFARTGATVGKSFLIEEVENAIFASYLIRIKPKETVHSKYLYLFFQSDNYWTQIRSHEVGAAQPNVNGQKLGKIIFPLPSIEIQKKIVAKLDFLFEKTDKSIALLEENLKHSQALLMSVLDEEFNKLIKDGVSLKPIKTFAKTKSGGTPSRGKREYWKGEIPWLKSGELNDSFNISVNTEFITDDGLKKSSATLFEKGTLLMAMYGATAGKLGILGMDASTNQAVCSIQNDRNLFDEIFLFFFLYSQRDTIIRDSSGGAQPNISKGYIDNFLVPLPSLEIQHLLSEKFFKYQENTNKIFKTLNHKLQNLKVLKSSLLDQAFKGEL